MRPLTSGDPFAGGGAYGQRLREVDWAASPLGPPEGWPQNLRSAVPLVLSSRYPMLLFWGDRCSQIYNEAYAGLIGDKHPGALGADVRDTLAEGWDVLGPIIDQVFATGRPSWIPALQLLLDRSGYREEAYFSVSHSVVRDDDGRAAGIFAVCSEVTEQVVGERRLRMLRDLGGHPGEGRSTEQTAAALIRTIEAHTLDVPFAALYLLDGTVLRRRTPVTGRLESVLPSVVALDGSPDDEWGVRRAAGGTVTVLREVAHQLALPAGPWGDPLHTAVALPLHSADPERPLGVMLVGVSPSRALDETYQSFLEILAQQVSVALRNARAYEEERQRAEALAELDRAKTEFFTNVSHEFRTPLTLMLGPLADALEDAAQPLEPVQRDRVGVALRNANRLLALVNNLLTFSSLEADRSRGVTTPVDLSALTAEFASLFRSAVERAGLRLEVDAPPLSAPVLMDPGHWEKIVANLLSNALKFTFVGSIRVELRHDGPDVSLTVRDTGIGIGPDDLPRLFERFQRVHGARARSHEGTGIGLALVRELARLYGGDVHAESAPGAGSTFTVTLPWSALTSLAAGDGGGLAPPHDASAGDAASDGDRASLPAQRPAAMHARAVAEQAAQWTSPLPESTGQAPPATREPVAVPRHARILVADDNADMRAYLVRLLTAQQFTVEAVDNGTAALEAIRLRPPDLLLTDVMMPDVDGFELIRTLRRDDATRALPVVVLSARAGHDASVALLDLGADDYIVKPFQAADLLARIRGTIQLARARTRHTRHLSALADTAAVIASGRALDDAVRAVTEQARLLLYGEQAVTVLTRDGRPELDVVSPAQGTVPDDASSISTPILGRQGRSLGTLTVWALPGRLPQSEQRALLQPVSQILAALVESTWQLEHEQQITATLQRGLLPERLPEAEGLDLAAAYLPASAEIAIGGDWYDALSVGDGRIALVVGDVAGHDVNAAVTMGQLRSTARTYLTEGLPVDQVANRLHDLAVRLTPWSFATCFLAYLDPDTGELEWCNAGQPPPVVHDIDGVPDWLEGPVNPPLGTGTAGAVSHRSTLAPGALLLLYTDGLVEHRASPLDDGMPALLRRVQDAADCVHVRQLVDAVVPSAAAMSRHDDIAVLAVRRAAPTVTPTMPDVISVSQRWTYRSTPQAASAMRRNLREVFRHAGIEDAVAYELLIAASEAVNNAVEHAQNPSHPEVEVTVDVDSDRALITVQDFGSWRGRRSAMDRGRGSALMAAAGDVRVTPTATGTTVTIERPLRPV